MTFTLRPTEPNLPYSTARSTYHFHYILRKKSLSNVLMSVLL